jgi:hypothetical protein
MNARRFDSWTRNRALRLSRRDALRLVGATGAVSALPQLAAPALAQTTCSLTIHAETAAGPSAPIAYDGVLQFELESNGAFTRATFTHSGGSGLAVTGQATGRSIDFQFDLGSDQTLTFAGAGAQPAATCPFDAAGLFSGPQPGDLGGWRATSGSASSAAAPATSSQSPNSSAQGSTLSCPPPQTGCGQNCCPGGATCTDAATGICACPDGSVQCGSRCVQDCPGGQTLDLDTCQCPNCVEINGTCAGHDDCCSGYCGGGTCFECTGIVCGSFGCVDPNRDNLNCGGCGNVCPAPQVCADGSCGCGPAKTPCVNHNECCSLYCNVFFECQDCSTRVYSDGTVSTFCGEGICVNLTSDIDHCGACFRACPRTSGGIVCDAGVCHDINSDPNYCGFAAEVCGPGKICHLGDCINA